MVNKFGVKSELLTREEAAAYLGIAVQTLAVWKTTGRYDLPIVKVGRLAKYRRSDLDAFLTRRTPSLAATTLKASGSLVPVVINSERPLAQTIEVRTAAGNTVSIPLNASAAVIETVLRALVKL